MDDNTQYGIIHEISIYHWKIITLGTDMADTEMPYLKVS